MAKPRRAVDPMDPQGLYRGVLRLAKLGCLCPLYSAVPRRNALHRVYMAAVWTLSSLHAASQLAYICVHHRDVSRVVETLGFFICLVNNSLRALIVLLMPDAVKSIVTLSSTHFRRAVVLPGVARFDIRRWEVGAYLWTLLYAAAGAAILGPLIVGTGALRLLRGTHAPLPAKAWYPFDTSTGAGWAAAYTLQVAVMPMVGVMLVAADGLCVTVVALTCGQLELLRKEIGYLERTAWANVRARTAPGQRVCERRVDLEREALLGKYSETHKTILSFIDLLEKPLKHVAFINSWILTICLVTTAFEILNVRGLSVPRLIAIGVYLQTSISFVFVYCFIGDKLIEEQEKVRYELYRTEWTFSSRRYKYTLRYMLLRAQVPTQVTVGKLAVLNLETYVDELNRAFTVFNAMVQLRQS
ncbi:hypothetical protein ONE63_003202 [Megalurothrips usitatus]|uniref:Odorant receptor n=1 Tax=Megalurothrips usitatus TaxID=439358 RepID=A0AAV7XAS2_9NEOP|nr:hypothetical protein ONE63_003202 [Megalurothrips usitatus]